MSKGEKLLGKIKFGKLDAITTVNKVNGRLENFCNSVYKTFSYFVMLR